MYLCDTCKNIERIEASGWPITRYDYYCQIHGHIDPCVKCMHYVKGEPRKVDENCESNNL